MKRAVTGSVRAKDFLPWNDYRLPWRHLNLHQSAFGFDVSGETRKLLSNNRRKTFYSELTGSGPLSVINMPSAGRHHY